LDLLEIDHNGLIYVDDFGIVFDEDDVFGNLLAEEFDTIKIIADPELIFLEVWNFT